MPEVKKLKDLEIGDIFFSVKDKNKSLFIKRGLCVFNMGAGSSTCCCFDIKKQSIVNKMCRIDVIKTRDSEFKEKYKANPLNTIHHAYNKRSH